MRAGHPYTDVPAPPREVRSPTGTAPGPEWVPSHAAGPHRPFTSRIFISLGLRFSSARTVPRK
jgi:hypothetical protein